MSPDIKEMWGRLEQGRFVLLAHCPWFEPALTKIVPKPKPGLGTCAMSEDGIMWFDHVVLDWSPKQMAGVLLHEALHKWNRHHARRQGRDPKLFNLACDAAMYAMIIATGLELPEGSVTCASLGVPEGSTAEQAYECLVQRAENERDKQGGGEGDGKSLADYLEDAGVQVPATPGPGKGWCGGVAGNPVPGEPEAGSDPDGRDEEDLAVGFRAVADNVQKAQPGSVPGGWRALANVTLAPPKVRWQDRLAYVARCSARWRPGARRAGYRSPSHLQWGIGYGASKPILATRYDVKPKVCIAIDTSASMGKRELQEAVSETEAIMRHLGGSVRFIACDAEVHKDIEAKTVKDVIENLDGGGGTSFVPVFERLESLPVRERPDILVFATDGWGRAPDSAPDWCKTIWLVTSGGGTPSRWGEVVRMDS